jgi:hypothetical protein
MTVQKYHKKWGMKRQTGIYMDMKIHYMNDRERHTDVRYYTYLLYIYLYQISKKVINIQ